MGFDTAVYLDQDGRVRQVKVRVGARLFRRPIVKLFVRNERQYLVCACTSDGVI